MLLIAARRRTPKLWQRKQATRRKVEPLRSHLSCITSKPSAVDYWRLPSQDAGGPDRSVDHDGGSLAGKLASITSSTVVLQLGLTARGCHRSCASLAKAAPKDTAVISASAAKDTAAPATACAVSSTAPIANAMVTGRAAPVAEVP
jgi:hypothetical protein